MEMEPGTGHRRRNSSIARPNSISTSYPPRRYGRCAQAHGPLLDGIFLCHSQELFGSLEEALVEFERNRHFDDDFVKLRMLWIQQVIVFCGNDS